MSSGGLFWSNPGMLSAKVLNLFSWHFLKIVVLFALTFELSSQFRTLTPHYVMCHDVVIRNFLLLTMISVKLSGIVFQSHVLFQPTYK